MAGAYWNGSSVNTPLVDTDFANPLNYYADNAFTIPFGVVAPGAGDTVYIYGAVMPTVNSVGGGITALLNLDTSNADAGTTIAAAVTAGIAISGDVTMGVSGNNASVHVFKGTFGGAYIGQGGSDLQIVASFSGVSVTLSGAAKAGRVAGSTPVLTLSGTFTTSGSGVTLYSGGGWQINAASISIAVTADNAGGGSIWCNASGNISIEILSAASTASIFIFGDQTAGGGCVDLTLTNFYSGATVPFHGTITGAITLTNSLFAASVACGGAFTSTGAWSGGGVFLDITAASISMTGGAPIGTGSTHTTTGGAATYSGVTFNGNHTFALTGGGLSITTGDIGTGTKTVSSGTSCTVAATSGAWVGPVTVSGDVSITRFKSGVITPGGSVTLVLLNFVSGTIASGATAVTVSGEQWTGAVTCSGLFTMDRPPGAASYVCGGISFTQPTAGDLRSGAVVGSVTGTCAVPSAADTRRTVPVDATTGTCYVPSASDTRLGVNVDNTTGTLPVIAATKPIRAGGQL